MECTLKFKSRNTLQAELSAKLAQQPLTTNHIPARTCTALLQRIHNMWDIALLKWAGVPFTCSPACPVQWHWIRPPQDSFTTSTNAALRRIVAPPSSPTQPPTCFGTNLGPFFSNWPGEMKKLAWVAPTRWDIYLQLIRNALPLGIKCVQWSIETQTRCVLCSTQAVETARHLLWDCTYAQQLWNVFSTPWNKPPPRHISWANILVGSLHRSMETPCVSKFWAVVRCCVIRVIWLERNLRVFNPNINGHAWAQRACQAGLDIKAHMDSAIHRLSLVHSPELPALLQYIARIKAYHTQFRRILNAVLFQDPP